MYDNGTKETWRGWAWNQIMERMGKSYSYDPKRVCVLAGDIAGDLSLAKKHKVHCVGVDFETDCVETFRKSGGVAVCDDLRNQVLCLQPNALIADFLGGITPDRVFTLIDAMGICDAVVFNFLRGRDRGIREPAPGFGKHRGRIALSIVMARLYSSGCELKHGISKLEVFEKLFMAQTKPEFYSYRSKDSGQYFDSVAISTSTFCSKDRDILMAKVREQAPIESRRKAAAAKAVLNRSK